MDNSFVDVQLNGVTGAIYSIKAADLKYWDTWWQDTTYESYRRLQASTLFKFLVALESLVNSGDLSSCAFLFQMHEYDRETWVIRAHRQCHSLWRENPKGFPSCGIQQSFDNLRAFRKAAAQEKKKAKSAVKQMDLK